jgi:hypothetical protein
MPDEFFMVAGRLRGCPHIQRLLPRVAEDPRRRSGRTMLRDPSGHDRALSQAALTTASGKKEGEPPATALASLIGII